MRLTQSSPGGGFVGDPVEPLGAGSVLAPVAKSSWSACQQAKVLSSLKAKNRFFFVMDYFSLFVLPAQLKKSEVAISHPLERFDMCRDLLT
jgi:hypothetical protein